MRQNRALLFKAIPQGMPQMGSHLVVEDIGFDISLKVPTNGALLKVDYASFDPYLRGRMRPKEQESYFPAFDLNSPIETGLVGTVIESSNSTLKVGDIIRTFGPLQEYWLITSDMINQLNPVTQLPLIEHIENPYNLQPADFLGALGMPGITAYSSFYEIGRPKKGQVIFISAASGSVGSLVGQLAKHEGLFVIGSVGDDVKLDYITNELGFDAGFNYKKESTKDALARLAPEGLDIYFDNVGGETLQAAFDILRNHGRVIICGMISQYNLAPEEQYRLAGTSSMFGKRIKMQGFIQSDADFGPKWGKKHVKNVSKWIANDTFKTKNHITRGIDNAASGLIGIFKGENFGKAILEL